MGWAALEFADPRTLTVQHFGQACALDIFGATQGAVAGLGDGGGLRRTPDVGDAQPPCPSGVSCARRQSRLAIIWASAIRVVESPGARLPKSIKLILAGVAGSERMSSAPADQRWWCDRHNCASCSDAHGSCEQTGVRFPLGGTGRDAEELEWPSAVDAPGGLFSPAVAYPRLRGGASTRVFGVGRRRPALGSRRVPLSGACFGGRLPVGPGVAAERTSARHHAGPAGRH